MKKRLLLILICIVFLFVVTMYAVREVVDQDAARFALMARHVLAGKHFPIFYYGRAYVGSPKAYFMSALFSLFGPTNFTVILSTVLLSTGFVFLTFKFVREAYGERVALLTVAYFALPPPVLGCWYTRGISPYIELLLTGAGMMLLGYRLIFTELGVRKRCLSNLLFGFLAGVGWWLSPMILYYLVPLSIFWFIKRRKKFLREDFSMVVPAFILGSMPFWLHNVYHNFMTFGMAKPLDWSQVGESFHRMFFYRLPELLELSCESGRGSLWELLVRRVLGAAYVLLIIYTLWVSRGKLAKKSSALGVTWMLLLFVGFAVWSYTTTGYQASKTERLILPLYWVFPILLAFCTSRLINKRRLAGWLLCFLVVVVHTIGNVACWRKNPVRGFRKEYQKLIFYLSQNDLLYVTSDFFNAPGLSFESGESIIAADGFSSCTIPGYLNRVLSANNYACIFPLGQSHRFESGLRNIGALWKRDIVGHYKIYHSFSNDAHYEEISTEGWSAIASGGDNASLAFDRFLSTRWTARCPQETGQYFELDMGCVCAVGKVELLSPALFDYPRGLRILTSLDGEVWEKVLETDSCFPPMTWCGPKPMWGSSELGAGFRFPARESRFVRIELVKKSERWWWSIDEIFVYSPRIGISIPLTHPSPQLGEEGGVISVLERECVQNVFTDFWIASKLISAGFSPDRVSTITNPLDYHNSLVPKPFPPDRTVPMIPGTGFLLWKGEAEEVINMLDKYGICYKREEVNIGFIEHLRKKGSKLELIKIVRRPSPVEYKLVPHANWEAKAFPPGNDTLFAFDGNIETRWTSEEIQFPGMVFELDIGKVVKISAVGLNAERESEDQPAALELWISRDGQEWKRVGLRSNSYKFLWTGKHLLLSSKRLPVILYTFSPQSLRYIRLVQKGTDDLHYWSIRELNLYSK